jgi:16S rRNA G966 N2-methylase RsmD
MGGKRKLLGQIFKHLPGPAQTSVFVDAFLGGGSVSLMAKARGYRVLCNDIAERSRIIGEALIANDRVTLDEADVLRLFAGEHDGTFIVDHFAPDVVPTKHARFLDRAFAVARSIEGPKHWLLMLLLVKYILRLRPMGNFGAKAIIRQIENQNWEAIKPAYMREIVHRGIDGHPKRICETLRRQINAGIFGNGQVNSVACADVFDFLKQIDGGDILYLDPPYSGTSAYETALCPLDSMITGRVIDPEPSVFSRRDAVAALERLFEAAHRFPLWAISYGNTELSLDDLVRIVRRFRCDVRTESFHYIHLTGLSSAEKREQNREFLIIAKGDK